MKKKLLAGSITASAQPSRSGPRARVFASGGELARRGARRCPASCSRSRRVSEASAAWVGTASFVDPRNDRSHRRRLLQSPSYVRLPATATTRETDIPTTFSKLIHPGWAVTFTETYRIQELANAPDAQRLR